MPVEQVSPEEQHLLDEARACLGDLYKAFGMMYTKKGYRLEESKRATFEATQQLCKENFLSLRKKATTCKNMDTLATLEAIDKHLINLERLLEKKPLDAKEIDEFVIVNAHPNTAEDIIEKLRKRSATAVTIQTPNLSPIPHSASSELLSVLINAGHPEDVLASPPATPLESSAFISPQEEPVLDSKKLIRDLEMAVERYQQRHSEFYRSFKQLFYHLLGLTNERYRKEEAHCAFKKEKTSALLGKLSLFKEQESPDVAAIENVLEEITRQANNCRLKTAIHTARGVNVSP